jgi:hypothetical protein
MRTKRTVTGNSETLARHRAETALLKTDRVLALLCRMEAIADHRADNDVAALAKLPTLRDLAREAIEAHTRTAFNNPLFPPHTPRPVPAPKQAPAESLSLPNKPLAPSIRRHRESPRRTGTSD